MIDYVEIEIGGQAIDKHYGEWLDLWTQLSSNQEQYAKLERIVNGSLHQQPQTGVTAQGDVRKLYIPLQFWFNRNPGLALPLIALQYHEVKIVIEFSKQSEIAWNNGSGPASTSLNAATKLTNVCLFCDYIFLDTDERRRFAQVSHEYLIEQLQTTGTCSFKGDKQKVNIPLNFNHPCKEIVWVIQDSKRKGTFDFTVTGRGNDSVGIEREQEYVGDAVLQLNGHDRFRKRDGSYFRLVQPYQHHGSAPNQGYSSSLTNGAANARPENGYMYAYSFALKPCEHQPSGTCNFSRIDNAVLNMTLADVISANNSNRFKVTGHGDKDVRVYTTNYNVLRIMSGMGGLAYSN